MSSMHGEKRSRKPPEKRSKVWEFYTSRKDQLNIIKDAMECKICAWHGKPDKIAKTRFYDTLRKHLMKSHEGILEEAESSRDGSYHKNGHRKKLE